MDASSLLAVIGQLQADGICVWIDGGWGVDALLDQQTREHDDLDLVIELDDAARVMGLILSLERFCVDNLRCFVIARLLWSDDHPHMVARAARSRARVLRNDPDEFLPRRARQQLVSANDEAGLTVEALDAPRLSG